MSVLPDDIVRLVQAELRDDIWLYTFESGSAVVIAINNVAVYLYLGCDDTPFLTVYDVATQRSVDLWFWRDARTYRPRWSGKRTTEFVEQFNRNQFDSNIGFTNTRFNREGFNHSGIFACRTDQAHLEEIVLGWVTYESAVVKVKHLLNWTRFILGIDRVYTDEEIKNCLIYYVPLSKATKSSTHLLLHAGSVHFGNGPIAFRWRPYSFCGIPLSEISRLKTVMGNSAGMPGIFMAPICIRCPETNG